MIYFIGVFALAMFVTLAMCAANVAASRGLNIPFNITAWLQRQKISAGGGSVASSENRVNSAPECGEMGGLPLKTPADSISSLTTHTKNHAAKDTDESSGRRSSLASRDVLSEGRKLAIHPNQVFPHGRWSSRNATN